VALLLVSTTYHSGPYGPLVPDERSSFKGSCLEQGPEALGSIGHVISDNHLPTWAGGHEPWRSGTSGCFRAASHGLIRQRPIVIKEYDYLLTQASISDSMQIAPKLLSRAIKALQSNSGTWNGIDPSGCYQHRSSSRDHDT